LLPQQLRQLGDILRDPPWLTAHDLDQRRGSGGHGGISLSLSQNREVSMIRLVSRGRFTHDFVKALIGTPEDREPAVRKLIEGAGGKVISYYVTTGETDFLLISEANEAEAVTPR
jgi:uncharacterized protein with GYD domain